MRDEKDKTPESSAEMAGTAAKPEAVTEKAAPEPAETKNEDEPEAVLTPEDIDRLVSEAEERGYLRGRNEAVEKLMNRPGRKRPEERADDGEDAVMILKEMRRSVWE